MNKDRYKFLTIGILVVITSVIIFAFSNLKENGNLSADNKGNSNNNTPPVEQPFEFVNARTSQVADVNFENNFGGNSEDDIIKVYNLDYYYIVGNTKSNSHYFEKNKSVNNIFVIKTTKLGNAISVSLPSENLSLVGVDCHITSQGIYILCHNTNSKTLLYFYSFNLNTITLVMEFPDFIPMSLTINNTFFIIGIKNSNLTCLNYDSQDNKLTELSTNIKSTQLLFISPYKNGVITFTNSISSFNAVHFDTNTHETLYSSSQLVLGSFTINSLGYFVFRKSNNK